MAPLNKLAGIELHVVAQIVETEFIVGAVGNIGIVGCFALLVVQAVGDDAAGKAQKFVNLAHPPGIAAGQVIVDGNHMHALAGKGVEHHRQRGHKGFAFACLHFGDLALVQGNAAKQLHVVMAQAQGAHRRFAHQGKHFRKQGIEAPALLHFLFILFYPLWKILIRKRLHCRFKGVYFPDKRL